MCALGWKTSIIENFCEVPLENDELYESVEIQTVSRDAVSYTHLTLPTKA